MPVQIGRSGWSYADSVEKGGGVKVFYPDAQIKKLQYYSQFFKTAEMDATFYQKFYKYMTKDTFINMSRATPNDFQFSVKVPETVTHDRRLDINNEAMIYFKEFLDKISPLKINNKLGAVLIQLPPSFTVKESRNTEEFLDRLPSGYDYAIEFRNPSWNTEGPWEMLKHYNIAAVMTDSPEPDKQNEVRNSFKPYNLRRFMSSSSPKGEFGIVAGSSVWARRFMAAAIIQGAIIVTLTVFLVLSQISILKPEVPRVIASGGAGTWFTFGYFIYIVVGVIGVAVSSLFYHYLGERYGAGFGYAFKALAWIHLILMNVGVMVAAALMMLAGYQGGAAMLPAAIGGKGFDAEQAHAILAPYVEPIAVSILVLMVGVIAGGAGFLLAYGRQSKFFRSVTRDRETA